MLFQRMYNLAFTFPKTGARKSENNMLGNVYLKIIYPFKLY